MIKPCNRVKPCDHFPSNSDGKCTRHTCYYWTGGIKDSQNEIKLSYTKIKPQVFQKIADIDEQVKLTEYHDSQLEAMIKASYL